MKAAVFSAAGEDLHIADVADPVAEPGMLVFRVKAYGICASDLHAVEVPGMLAPGTVLGHEYSGEVVSVGAGVSGWQPGERIIGFPAKPCGSCAACAAGNFTGCEQVVMQGFDPRMPGAYAEYSSCVAALAIRVPDALSDTDAALVEPLTVGLGAWKAAQVADGASVLVIGAGIIGLAVAKWAKFFGAAEVAVSEMVPARRERARAAGVDLVIDASAHPDPVAEFARLCGRKPSVIFECVGRPLLARLIEIAPMGAHLVLVGTGMQPESFTVVAAAMKRLRMTFTLGYEPADFDFTLRMLGAGRITADPLVTATVPLDEAPAMFAALGKPNDHCKVLIRPHG